MERGWRGRAMLDTLLDTLLSRYQSIDKVRLEVREVIAGSERMERRRGARDERHTVHTTPPMSRSRPRVRHSLQSLLSRTSTRDSADYLPANPPPDAADSRCVSQARAARSTVSTWSSEPHSVWLKHVVKCTHVRVKWLGCSTN